MIKIFTDGACLGNPGPGGWAALIKYPDQNQWQKIVGAEMATTNNRMELTAAIKAMENVRNDHLDASKDTIAEVPIVIHSDSQYLVKGMNLWIKDWQKRGWKTAGKKSVQNIDLWQKLLELSQGLSPRPQFAWVRGHEGNPKNEEVDRLAKKAAEGAEHTSYTQPL